MSHRTNYMPYFDYLKIARDYKENNVLNDTLEIIRMYQNQLSIIHNLSPVLYLLDYISNQYVFISHSLNTVLGLKPSYLMEGGVLEYATRCHQEDVKIYSENVFPENFKLLKSVSPEKHKNLVFTTNYRVKRKDGKYISLMEKYMYIRSTQDGTPLTALGFAYDISPFKTDTKMIHTIEEVNTTVRDTTSRIILHNNFFPREEDSLLSSRELEILKWICEGLNSHQIADKLNLSIYTINNHRKKILEKTNCKNPVEILKYAISKGLI